MTVTAAGQPHAHTEQWALQPRLSGEARALALDVLPVLRHVKRALVELGGRAIVGSSPEDLRRAEEIAHTLAGRCRLACGRLGPNDSGAGLAPIQNGLVNALSALEVWARAVEADDGHISREAAAGLREAYVGLRHAAEPLWRLELAPEGRGHHSGQVEGLLR